MHPDADFDSFAAAPGSAPPLPPPARESLGGWLRGGLRAGFLLEPRLPLAPPTPAQLLLLVAVTSALELLLARFEVAGPALFDLRGWLAPQWGTGLLLLLAWWVLPPPRRLAAWFALWVVASAPANTVSQLLSIAQAHERLPLWLDGSTWAGWSLYLLLWVWVLAVAVRLAGRFGVDRPGRAALALRMVALFGVSAWQFPDRPWQQDGTQAEAERPTLELSQEAFETQQAVWDKAVASLAPQRPGVVDVYGLVFAPYADQDVFLRESSMVASLLAQRFDARGRVLHLVNSASTGDTYPWATTLNLERAIDALAARMDREHDLLVVYLTSHGASNYQLSASNGALRVDTVSPGELRAALDKAGIRNRVIAVSACFSGGWIGPLAGDSTLVMTAADATHTSYGCGALSELTFFGRAMFDEQLRKTHSFEQAFAASVPVIKQREVDAGKPDGFSNPQISVGDKIRPVLRQLQQRLDGLPPAPGATP
ncbi:C13 family peptidase [Caenimonas terrae]|uniref:C13 family peptidase n=1 Tax=Caenimonas terrae TaxID=696074 RepID=A0ABW0ND78_9BURK